MKRFLRLFSLLLCLFSAACTANSTVTNPSPPPAALQASPAPVENNPADSSATPVSAPAVTPMPASTQGSQSSQAAVPTATPKPTLASLAWQSLPVIPPISARVVEIYQHGLELGNNPYAFSKIGDCGSTPAWFLGDFDRGARYYSLGEYTELESVILSFQGSFARTSLAAKSGFNASSVFTTLWADPAQCESNETPLACEYRVHKPAFALITLGTNDIWHQDTFEPQMRRIIEFSIETGVVPILSTKADNEEGDGSINATIAALAYEYDIPLWNYWLAVQSLPDQGLQEDGAHITWGPNRFDDPKVMEKGWPVRNLTALQLLDQVLQAVNSANAQ